MNTTTESQQTIQILHDQDTNLFIWADAFLMDRKAQGLSPATIGFYKEKLTYFLYYCEGKLIRNIPQLTANDIRGFMLSLEDSGHNPGGCHSFYRVIRVFLNWWENELEPVGWKNPMRNLKAPKVALEPLEPAKIETIQALLETCKSGNYYDDRDRAIIMVLADTGLRASEFLSVDLNNIDPIKGMITVLKTKSKKFRHVFLGKKTRKALRKYLNHKKDCEGPLWTHKNNDRLEYLGLRAIIRKRSLIAKVKVPSIHSFRRFFALECLRNGMDIFSLQVLMGHSDLQILKRYLKQTDGDIRAAHNEAGPIDNIK